MLTSPSAVLTSPSAVSQHGTSPEERFRTFLFLFRAHSMNSMQNEWDGTPTLAGMNSCAALAAKIAVGLLLCHDVMGGNEQADRLANRAAVTTDLETDTPEVLKG